MPVTKFQNQLQEDSQSVDTRKKYGNLNGSANPCEDRGSSRQSGDSATAGQCLNL